MGTTSQKLTYLNDTKQELKQKINNLGGDITNQTTFRQYADELQNVYDIFPKTSYAEGSNITLSNTLKGKLDFEDGIVGYGQTSQEGTPTPSTPIDIEVVRGKNLLDMSNAVGGTNNGITCTFNSDKSYSFKGTATNNNINVWFLGNYNSSTTLFTLKAGTYHIQDVILFNGTTPLNYSTFYNGPITLANDTNITGVRAPQVTSGTTYNETKYPMIVKGSQATSYLPYNTIEVVERGKNLINNTATSGTTSGITFTVNEDKSVKVNGTYSSTVYYVLTNNSKIEPNTEYIISGASSPSCRLRVREYDVNNNNLSEYFDQGYDATFTSKSNVDHINVQIVVYSSQTNAICYPMIRPSSITDDTYEPYITPITKQLSLGEYEFAKIGNYVDTIEYDVENDKVYKNEIINKKLLSTSDTWALNRSSNNLYQYRTKNDLLEDVITSPDPYSRAVALCNYYTKGDINGMTTQCFNIGGLKYIGITSDISTLANFNTFITNNNIYVYYVKQNVVPKEITTILKDQIKALYNSQSFNGTTIIEIDGQLPLIIKVRALKGE